MSIRHPSKAKPGRAAQRAPVLIYTHISTDTIAQYHRGGVIFINMESRKQTKSGGASHNLMIYSARASYGQIKFTHFSLHQRLLLWRVVLRGGLPGLPTVFLRGSVVRP